MTTPSKWYKWYGKHVVDVLGESPESSYKTQENRAMKAQICAYERKIRDLENNIDSWFMRFMNIDIERYANPVFRSETFHYVFDIHDVLMRDLKANESMRKGFVQSISHGIENEILKCDRERC